MKILCIGDVVGQVGCTFFKNNVSRIKKENSIDVVIVNGENSAEGNGITPYSADQLFEGGADVITTGNHVLRRKEIYPRLGEGKGIIRPANIHASAPGFGYYIYDGVNTKLVVINVQGTVFMDTYSNPFDKVDKLLTSIKYKNIIVDLHAEATSEKRAMAEYLDGRVSLVYGTHTHVQTSDEQILTQGTGFITDLGMCGAKHSVLGVKVEQALKKMRTCLPVRFESAQGDCMMGGIIAEIDSAGKTILIERVNIR